MDETRMDRLESRFAIEALIANYAHGFDCRNLDLFLGLWWEDCTLIAPGPVGTIRGHAALSHLVEGQLWPTWHWSMHITTNCTVSFMDEDPDRAHALSNVCCLGHNDQDVGQALFASYRDIVERRSGIWKLATRTVDMRWGGAAAALLGDIETKLGQ